MFCLSLVSILKWYDAVVVMFSGDGLVSTVQRQDGVLSTQLYTVRDTQGTGQQMLPGYFDR